MSASKKCKEEGLNSLAELARISGEDRRKLHSWFHLKPDLFECVLAGAIVIKNKRDEKL